MSVRKKISKIVKETYFVVCAHKPYNSPSTIKVGGFFYKCLHRVELSEPNKKKDVKRKVHTQNSKDRNLSHDPDPSPKSRGMSLKTGLSKLWQMLDAANLYIPSPQG